MAGTLAADTLPEARKGSSKGKDHLYAYSWIIHSLKALSLTWLLLVNESFMQDVEGLAYLGVGVDRIEVSSSDGVPESNTAICGATP